MKFEIILVLSFLLIWQCQAQKIYSGKNLNTPPENSSASNPTELIQLDVSSPYIYKYPKFTTVNPYQFTTSTFDSKISFDDLKQNTTVQVAPICRENEIKYNFDLVYKFKRNELQVVDYAKSGNYIYFVNLGGDSSLEVYKILENSTKGVNSLSIMVNKNMDILTPPDKIYQVSDLNVFLVDDLFVLVRIEATVLVFSLPIEGNPIYKGNFTVANIDDPTLRKTQYYNNCLYLLDADSLIKVFCLNREKDYQFNNTYNFTPENLAMAINEKERPQDLENSPLRIEDFWVEDNLLMILDKTYGLFIYNIEAFSNENTSYAFPKQVYYEKIIGGKLIKKANQSLLIVYEFRSNTNAANSDSYLIEYFIIGKGTPQNISLKENRREYFQYSKIKNIHRTREYVLTEEDNIVRILKHSLPRVPDILPLAPANVILENLINIHQAGSDFYDNLVLVAFPDELHFYSISSNPYSLVCQSSESGKRFTVATQFYSPTCPEKKIPQSMEPDSYCVNLYLTQFAVGVISKETDKTVGLAVGLSLGLLFVVVVSICLIKKYNNKKKQYEKLQQEVVTKEPNSTDRKKAQHFEIDRPENQMGYSIPSKKYDNV